MVLATAGAALLLPHQLLQPFRREVRQSRQDVLLPALVDGSVSCVGVLQGPELQHEVARVGAVELKCLQTQRLAY